MQRRSSQLTIAMSRTFKRQGTWDVPMSASEMTMAFNATSRNYLTNEESVEDIYDCTGEELLIELVTSRFARLLIEFDVDPNMLAGWTAFNYGVAASPTGGVNAVQTLTQTGATGGTAQIRFTINYETQTSAALVYNAAAAAIQTALDAMPNIGAGNTLVAGGPLGTNPVTVTFQGALADLDVGLLEIVSALTPGGGAIAVVMTTPGVGRTHAISRIVGYTLPFGSMYVGFRNSDKQPVIFKNVICDSIRCRVARGETGQERIIANAALIGSADLQHAAGFTMPGCEDIEPMRFGDGALLINGSDLYQAGSIYGDPAFGLPLAREWEYYHDNGSQPKYDGAGIDVTRLERQDRRTSGFNLGVLGEEGDPLWLLARPQRPRSIASVDLRVGRTNNHVRFIAPQNILKLDNPSIRFEGRDNESNIRMMARPRKVTGDATTPTNVVAVTRQLTPYLEVGS